MRLSIHSRKPGAIASAIITVALSAPMPSMAEDARALLKKTGDFLSELNAVSVKATSAIQLEGDSNGEKQSTQLTLNYSIARSGADAIAIKCLSGVITQDGTVQQTSSDWPSMALHNGVVTVSLPGAGVIQAEGVNSIQEALKDERFGYAPQMGRNQFFTQAGAIDLLNGLWETAESNSWEADVTNAEYIGAETLESGESAHHIRFTQKGPQAEETHEVWLQDGERPLPLKATLDPALTNIQDPSVSITYSATWSEWNTQPELNAADFALNIEEDTETYASFATLIEAQRKAQSQSQSQPGADLLGKPAPAVELERLEGDEVFKLSELKGEKTVILDFWATWCGPCVRGIPELISISKEFADKDVVLIGVNLEEEPQQVKSFIRRQGWDLNVVLDKDSSVARKYQVSGIPQTVIVAKDGTVAKVHVGVPRDLAQMRQMYREELTEITAQ